MPNVAWPTNAGWYSAMDVRVPLLIVAGDKASGFGEGGASVISEIDFRCADLIDALPASDVSFFLKSLPKNFLGAVSGLGALEPIVWLMIESRKFRMSLLMSTLPRFLDGVASLVRDMVGVRGVLNDTIDNGRDVRPGGDWPSSEPEEIWFNGADPGTGSQTSDGSSTPTPEMST